MRTPILKFLLEKEFKLIARNTFLPKLIVIMPITMMLILPFAVNMEIKNINLAIVDSDHSSYSHKLIQQIDASDYFNLIAKPNTYNDAMQGIEEGSSDIILEIPANFEKKLVTGGKAQLLIAANAVNGSKGGISSSYLSAILQKSIMPYLSDGADIKTPPINIISQNRYNPHLNYRIFMVPALIVMLITIVCGFLPAFNIVGEKEVGTIEQMNVTPISKSSFILAKLIPFWIIGFVVLTLCFLLTWLVYGFLPQGSFFILYASSAIFILAISGLGLLISNNSQTMQQSLFVMFFFLLIAILLSGLFTPVSSMPYWAQGITVVNPLRYYIGVMRGVYLSGYSWADSLPDLGILSIFAIVLDGWAVISYHKRSA